LADGPGGEEEKAEHKHGAEEHCVVKFEQVEWGDRTHVCSFAAGGRVDFPVSLEGVDHALVNQQLEHLFRPIRLSS